MKLKKGYIYHLTDSLYENLKEQNLHTGVMTNKENGNSRPAYYCTLDKKTSLYILIPMSTRIEKYQKIYNKKLVKYGKCNTIVINKYGKINQAFLIQNMIPITSKYINNIHTILGDPIPLHKEVQEAIDKCVNEVKSMINRNILNITFTNYKGIENFMIKELEKEKSIESQPII